jgi:hypothetical protein
MHMFVIQTKPNRSLYGWRGQSPRVAVKYAKVRADRKFDWVLDLSAATLFTSMTDAVAALAKRGARIHKVTNDVTIAEVEQARPVPLPPPLTVKRIFNGG